MQLLGYDSPDTSGSDARQTVVHIIYKKQVNAEQPEATPRPILQDISLPAVNQDVNIGIRSRSPMSIAETETETETETEIERIHSEPRSSRYGFTDSPFFQDQDVSIRSISPIPESTVQSDTSVDIPLRNFESNYRDKPQPAESSQSRSFGEANQEAKTSQDADFWGTALEIDWDRNSRPNGAQGSDQQFHDRDHYAYNDQEPVTPPEYEPQPSSRAGSFRERDQDTNQSQFVRQWRNFTEQTISAQFPDLRGLERPWHNRNSFAYNFEVPMIPQVHIPPIPPIHVPPVPFIPAPPMSFIPPLPPFMQSVPPFERSVPSAPFIPPLPSFSPFVPRPDTPTQPFIPPLAEFTTPPNTNNPLPTEYPEYIHDTLSHTINLPASKHNYCPLWHQILEFWFPQTQGFDVIQDWEPNFNELNSSNQWNSFQTRGPSFTVFHANTPSMPFLFLTIRNGVQVVNDHTRIEAKKNLDDGFEKLRSYSFTSGFESLCVISAIGVKWSMVLREPGWLDGDEPGQDCIGEWQDGVTSNDSVQMFRYCFDGLKKNAMRRRR